MITKTEMTIKSIHAHMNQGSEVISNNDIHNPKKNMQTLTYMYTSTAGEQLMNSKWDPVSQKYTISNTVTELQQGQL